MSLRRGLSGHVRVGNRRSVEVEFRMTSATVVEFVSALEAGIDALEAEMFMCQANGDEEGRSLRQNDLKMLEFMLEQLEVAQKLAHVTTRATITADSAGAEGPSQDAASASSATALPSLQAVAASTSLESGDGPATGPDDARHSVIDAAHHARREIEEILHAFEETTIEAIDGLSGRKAPRC